MRWTKRGHIYRPDGSRSWARKYASFPTVDVRGDVLRVYFTGLDEHDFGRTGYVEVDASDPTRVLHESPEPVLDLGPIGSFDDCGANATSFLRDGSTEYLYYQGWQRTERIPYLIFTGLATRDANAGADGFAKHARTPILDRTDHDPFLRAAPYVIKDAGAFRMWFVSARSWTEDEHGLHYDVVIRHARSADGIRWEADEQPCLEPESSDDYAVGRPSVLRDGDGFRMWYGIRSFTQPYRVGYAESADGLSWTRRDADAGIERSESGWDSEMLFSPQVVRIDDRLLMFYNGNRHGESGFGYAEAA